MTGGDGFEGLRPGRGGGDADDAGAPGAGGVHGLLGGLDLEQDAPGAVRGDGAERGQSHAVGQAIEQAAAEAAFEPGDVAGGRV